MPIRVLLGTSLLLLTLSAVFGFLNTSKVRTPHSDQANTLMARQPAANVNAALDSAKMTDSAVRLANVEAELAKARDEKAALQARLQTNESQLAQLQKKVEELTAPEGPSVTELQAQLDEARQQLDTSEREKSLLAGKTQMTQPRSSQPVTEKGQRRSSAAPIGVHGTVLAVNQAYNFVVLDLGDRQGVETNAEMLVMRGGSLIGKIRVSSVEPSTAIGDIISSSLPRGVQVQTGDTVLYAGPNS